MDPFAVLGVDENADSEEIKRAYRERLKKAHPDRGGSKEEFERVRDAFQAVTGSNERTEAPEMAPESERDATGGETDSPEYVGRRDPEVPADRDAGVDTLEADETGERKLRALGVGVGVGVGGLLLGLLFTLVSLAVVGLFVDIGDLELIVLSLLMTQGLGLSSAAVAYVSWRGVGLGYVSARLPGLSDIAWVVAAYVVAIIGVVVVGVLLTLLGAPSANNQAAETATQSPEVLLVLIPGSFLLIGPGEELLFRGVVQTRIRETFGPIPGVFLASLIFAAVHVVALAGDPEGILVTVGVLMVPSLILGAAYEYTENIVVPALIHGAYNATLFGLLYVSLRFGDGVPESAALFL
jgi:membrane protease YdiL (CAAX protease family)